MDPYLIAGGKVVTLGAQGRVIDDGAVLVADGRIAEVGPASELKQRHGCPVEIDAPGGLVMPGLICAHHHFYSTLARGFAPPGEPGYTFREILERFWWKVDRALTLRDVRVSALIPLIECIRAGTTTVIDHHASPSCRDGSLDVIADAFLESGVRGSVCYEVSDRNEPGAGVEESRRFLGRLAGSPVEQLAGMVGLHASFTVSDDTLARCRALAEEFGVGCHLHVAEGTEDATDAQAKYGMRTVERLVERGLAGPKSLFIHCIDVSERELELIAETGTMVVHNPESNMNNAVGAAPVLDMLKRGILVGLGTDGMASDMLSQMRCAYLLWRHAHADPRVGFCEAPRLLLENNAAIASRLFGVELGALEEGAAADIAVFDYVPPTPLTEANFLGHLLFGLVNARCSATVAGGRVLMKEGQVLTLDEERIAAEARALAGEVWARIR